MHGLDDLGVIDPAQVRRGDPEVRVPELALDDDERNAFSRHVDDRNAGADRLTVASAEAGPGWGPGRMAGGRVGLRRVVARSGAGF